MNTLCELDGLLGFYLTLKQDEFALTSVKTGDFFMKSWNFLSYLDQNKRLQKRGVILWSSWAAAGLIHSFSAWNGATVLLSGAHGRLLWEDSPQEDTLPGQSDNLEELMRKFGESCVKSRSCGFESNMKDGDIFMFFFSSLMWEPAVLHSGSDLCVCSADDTVSLISPGENCGMPIGRTH